MTVMRNQLVRNVLMVFARYAKRWRKIVLCLLVLTVIVAFSVHKKQKYVYSAIDTYQKYTKFLEYDIFIKEYQKLGSSPNRVLTGIFLSYLYCSKR